jgi:endonuclease IV
MIVGSHVSCAGGFAKAVGRAIDVGCDCRQFFVSNPPRQWPVVQLTTQNASEVKPVHCKTKQANQLKGTR